MFLFPTAQTLTARMARKRRASPSPPPPPREEYSSSEEEAEATPATQKAPQNPKPPSTAAADADSSDGGGDESSDSKVDAEAFQLREVDHSPLKPSAAASKVESVADDEDGSSSESSEPVQKKAARTPKAEAGKKRQAAEPTPSGKAKKAKAEVEKAAPESTLSGKAKKTKAAGADKAPSEPNLFRKGKKHKVALPEKDVLDHSPSGKPEKPASRKRWTTEDEIKILEALVSHIKTNGTQPSATDLIAAVGDSLERNNCGKSEMYEKVLLLKQRHEITAKKAATTGTLPGNDDDIRKFNLSEQVWGERANEVASSKSKKRQTNKEKGDDHSKGVTAKEATSTKEKVDGDSKGRLSKKASTTDAPVKSKKRQNQKEELETVAAKTGTTKETTNTAAQNGGTLVRSKSGKSDKEKKDKDAESLGPKVATAVTQNDGTLTLLKNRETHEEKMDTDPNVKNMNKRLNELQNLYPNLTSYVESIQDQHPCGETLKRAFEFIADEKACALESKIKKQRVAEMKMDVRRADTTKEVTNIFIGLLG